MESSMLPRTDKMVTAHRDAAKAISANLRKAARKARSTQPVVRGGGGFRARKSDRYFFRFLVFLFLAIFLLPVTGAVLYYTAIADDQYVTEARFAVRSGSDTSIVGLSSLSSFIDTGQARDGLIIADYVKSSALVDALSKQFDLRQIFSKENDFIARFDETGSAEDLLEYWRNQIDINVDRNSGLITLKVRAFSPTDSLALTSSIIQEAESMVNQLTRKGESDELARTEKELNSKREKLQQMVSELRDVRNQAGILDVEMTAKSLTALLTDLRLELSKEELIIKTTASDAPQMQPLINRANALRAQIARYERVIAGEIDPANVKGTNLAEIATKIEQTDVNLEIAKQEYADAMVSYEGARLSMEQQRSYLLIYVPPQLAEEATYPRRMMMILVILLGSSLLMAVSIGIAFVVRDHMAK